MRKSILLIASMALAVLLASAVTLSIRTEPARAAFPGVNGKIVFVEHDNVQRDSGMKRISPNGSGLVTLVDNAPGSALVRDPVTSPDGTRVAYSQGPRKSSEIYKINVSNHTITRITHNNLFDGDPTWNPEGTRIAFERGADIFAKRADGTGKAVNLTNTPNEDEFGPAWSPNGEEIAFYTQQTDDIIVLNLKSGQRRNLTNDGVARNDIRPNWSPDGTRIVFESYASEGYASEDQPNCFYSDKIYTMNASDGSDRRLLAQACRDDIGDGYYVQSPTYSPNGKQVAYVKTYSDYTYTHPKLFKMNASDGSNKQLVYDAYDGAYAEGLLLLSPDWGVRAQP